MLYQQGLGLLPLSLVTKIGRKEVSENTVTGMVAFVVRDQMGVNVLTHSTASASVGDVVA